jgi:putative endonuclease
MSDGRRIVGRAGEDAVAQWYTVRGYRVLDRNWRVREGELDLVVERAGTIAFCEVKTRRSDAFGLPVEAVTPRKRQRLRTLARQWLASGAVRGARPAQLRFDVASVRPDAATGWIVDVLEGVF